MLPASILSVDLGEIEKPCGMEEGMRAQPNRHPGSARGTPPAFAFGVVLTLARCSEAVFLVLIESPNLLAGNTQMMAFIGRCGFLSVRDQAFRQVLSIKYRDSVKPLFSIHVK
jgi:hypothetical protein